MVRPGHFLYYCSPHLGTLFSGQGWLFEDPKTSPNALSPGADNHGELFYFILFLDSLSKNNSDNLFAFSWGVYFPNNYSETGFGQLLRFARWVSFPISKKRKIEEVIDEKPDMLHHFVRFLMQKLTLRF